MEKCTVSIVFGLAGGRCGIEGKHGGSVDAIVHEAFDSRVQNLVCSVVESLNQQCGVQQEAQQWCANWLNTERNC